MLRKKAQFMARFCAGCVSAFPRSALVENEPDTFQRTEKMLATEVGKILHISLTSGWTQTVAVKYTFVDREQLAGSARYVEPHQSPALGDRNSQHIQ